MRHPYRSAGFLATFQLGALAIGVWVISPRFSITGPSLIDDWNALVSAPSQLHALLHLDYGKQSRYYPTWILWNWAQWRVPGAPGNMLGPNLLGIARLALVVTGLTTFTAIVIPLKDRRVLEWALLCTLPALVVVTVPAFGIDLARFGPQEPAQVGGMMLGGALLYAGGRKLAREPVRAPVRAWLLVAVGLLAWCYGVFSKETSVCVLLALPLVLVPGVVRQLDRRQRMVAGGLISVALLPVLFMLYEVVRIVERGSLQYGAHVKTGNGAISIFLHAVHVMQHQMMSVLGVVLLVGLLAAIAVDWFMQRNGIDWVLLAILLVSAAALEMSVQVGYYESRYYLLSIALLAVGAARAVAKLPARYSRVIVAAGVVFALVSATKAHVQVQTWADGDEQGAQLVAAVREATQGGCRLSIVGIDLERTQSIRALVDYGSAHPDCAGAPRHVLVGPTAPQPAEVACGSKRSTPLGSWYVGSSLPTTLVRC